MLSPIVVEELRIPDTLDDPDAEPFRAIVDIYNLVNAHVMGPAAGIATAAEMLVSFQDQEYTRIRVFAISRDAAVVAMAYFAWSVEPDTRVSWIDIRVRPEYRNQGFGSALHDHLEQLSRDSGRPIVQGQGLHEAVDGDDRLTPPTGFGSLPVYESTVQFMIARGYSLEQVNRVSILHLPIPAPRLEDLLSTAQIRAGSEYRVHTWEGSTPERWLNDVALIMNRMSTDAPSGNLEIEEETWDADRVRHYDELRNRTGRIRLVAAVEYIPGGQLVAFNGLSQSEDRTQPVHQGVTLVLKEHRGHRLGMITKVANIQQLQALRPGSPSIITDNAEENRPMLDVNEAVGFLPLAYQGAWKKTFA